MQQYDLRGFRRTHLPRRALQEKTCTMLFVTRAQGTHDILTSRQQQAAMSLAVSWRRQTMMLRVKLRQPSYNVFIATSYIRHPN